MAGDKTIDESQSKRQQGAGKPVKNKSAEGGKQEEQTPQDPSVAEQLVDSGTQGLQDSVQNTVDSIASIKQEAEAAIQALEVAKVEFDNASAAIVAVKDKLAAAKEKYDAAKEKADPIEEEIDAAKAEYEAAEEQLESAEASAKDAGVELTGGERKAFQDKIDAAQAKVDAAKEKMEPVDEEFDVAKDDLKAAQTEMKAAQSGLEATTAGVAEAQTRVISIQDKALAAGGAVADTFKSIADGSIISELQASTALGDVDINLKGTSVEAEYAPDGSNWSIAASINAVSDVNPQLLGRYNFNEDVTVGGFHDFHLDFGLISGETGATRPNDVEGQFDFAPVRIGEFGHRDTYDGLGVRGVADYNFGEIDGTASTFLLANGSGGLDTSLTYDLGEDTRLTGGAGVYLGDEARLYLSGQIDQNTDWGSYYGRLQHTQYTGDSPFGNDDSLTTGSAGARINLGEDGQGIMLGDRGHLTDKFGASAWGIQYVDIRASLDSLDNSSIYGGVGLGKAGGMDFDVGAQYDNGTGDVTAVVSATVSF